MQKFTKLAAAALFLTAGLAANAQGLGTATSISPVGEYQSIYNMNSVSLEWDSKTFEFAEEEKAYVNVTYNRNSLSQLTATDGQIDINNPGAGMSDRETEDNEDMYSILIINLNSLTGLDTNEPSKFKYGEYEIYIPEGLLTDKEGNKNAAQTLTYQIKPEDYNNTITPLPSEGQLEPGIYNRTDLEDIVISYGGKFITINQQSEPISYVNQEGVEGTLNSTYISVSDDYTELYLNISSFEYGTYNFYIPAGYLILNSGEAINGPIYMTYTIFKGLSQPVVIEAPEQTVFANQISPLELSWDYQMVSFSNKENAYLSYYNKETGEIGKIEIPYSACTWSTINNNNESVEGEGNVLTIDLNSVLKDITGSYELIIPEGFVQTWDLNESPALNYNLDIYYPYTAGEVQFTASKEDKNVYFLSWKNAFDYQLVDESNEGGALYLTNGDDIKALEYYGEIEISPEELEAGYNYYGEGPGIYKYNIVEYNFDDNPFWPTIELIETKFVINFNKLKLDNGIWSLIIPEIWTEIKNKKEEIFLNEGASFNINWNNGTAAVKALEVEDANAPVVYYNLQGQVVTNPEKGQILIKKQGTKTSKVVY